MEPQFHLGDDLKELERALRQLAPAPTRLDVAQTMFRAGQATVSRPSAWQRIWPATSAVLALVSITLGGLLMVPDHRQVVYVPVDVQTHAAQPPAPTLAAPASHPAAGGVRSESPAESQLARWDARWLRASGYLRVSEMVAMSSGDIAAVAAPASQHAALPALCSGDWRAMVDEAHSPHDSAESAVRSSVDWKRFLFIRGS
jgi:hypothetical protein